MYRGANHQRLSYVRVNRHTEAILNLVPEENVRSRQAKLYGFDAVPSTAGKAPGLPKRVLWQEVVVGQDTRDLLPPQKHGRRQCEPESGVSVPEVSVELVRHERIPMTGVPVS